MKNIFSFIKTYKAKWLAADFLFASDILSNGLFGAEYYEVFTHIGVPGEVINTVASLLELARIMVLVYERHKHQIG